jgi:hypothetical protein
MMGNGHAHVHVWVMQLSQTRWRGGHLYGRFHVSIVQGSRAPPHLARKIGLLEILPGPADL